MSYWVVGSFLLNTAVQYDNANNAQHDNRVRAEEQARQVEEANRIQKQQLADQRAAQAANLAQAQRAAAESKAQMDRQLKAAEESMNRTTQKRPNTSRVVDEAAQAGRAGASGTMLTGSQGVDPGTLQLGRSTLLGQ